MISLFAIELQWFVYFLLPSVGRNLFFFKKTLNIPTSCVLSKMDLKDIGRVVNAFLKTPEKE